MGTSMRREKPPFESLGTVFPPDRRGRTGAESQDGASEVSLGTGQRTWRVRGQGQGLEMRPGVGSAGSCRSLCA